MGYAIDGSGHSVVCLCGSEAPLCTGTIQKQFCCSVAHHFVDSKALQCGIRTPQLGTHILYLHYFCRILNIYMPMLCDWLLLPPNVPVIFSLKEFS